MDEVISAEFRALIHCIHREWMRAEACMKQAEQVNSAVVIPSVKELRYAGRCLVNALELALNGGDLNKAKEYLLDAKFDCNRARHDAVDALISKITIDLDAILKTVGANVILENFPQMPDIVGKIDTVKREIVRSRSKSADRNNVYENIEDNDVTLLVNYMREIKYSTEILKGLSRKQEINRKISIAFGIAGIAFGIAILFIKAKLVTP